MAERTLTRPVRVTPVNESGARVGPTAITEQHITAWDGWLITRWQMVIRAGLVLHIDPHQDVSALRYRNTATGLDYVHSLAEPLQYGPDGGTFTITEDVMCTGWYWRWGR